MPGRAAACRKSSVDEDIPPDYRLDGIEDRRAGGEVEGPAEVQVELRVPRRHPGPEMRLELLEGAAVALDLGGR